MINRMVFFWAQTYRFPMIKEANTLISYSVEAIVCSARWTLLRAMPNLNACSGGVDSSFVWLDAEIRPDAKVCTRSKIQVESLRRRA